MGWGVAAKRIVAMSAKKEKEQSAAVRGDEGVAKRKTWKEKEENVGEETVILKRDFVKLLSCAANPYSLSYIISRN